MALRQRSRKDLFKEIMELKEANNRLQDERDTIKTQYEDVASQMETNWGLVLTEDPNSQAVWVSPTAQRQERQFEENTTITRMLELLPKFVEKEYVEQISEPITRVQHALQLLTNRIDSRDQIIHDHNTALDELEGMLQQATGHYLEGGSRMHRLKQYITFASDNHAELHTDTFSSHNDSEDSLAAFKMTDEAQDRMERRLQDIVQRLDRPELHGLTMEEPQMVLHHLFLFLRRCLDGDMKFPPINQLSSPQPNEAPALYHSIASAVEATTDYRFDVPVERLNDADLIKGINRMRKTIQEQDDALSSLRQQDVKSQMERDSLKLEIENRNDSPEPDPVRAENAQLRSDNVQLREEKTHWYNRANMETQKVKDLEEDLNSVQRRINELFPEGDFLTKAPEPGDREWDVVEESIDRLLAYATPTYHEWFGGEDGDPIPADTWEDQLMWLMEHMEEKLKEFHSLNEQNRKLLEVYDNQVPSTQQELSQLQTHQQWSDLQAENARLQHVDEENQNFLQGIRHLKEQLKHTEDRAKKEREIADARGKMIDHFLADQYGIPMDED